VRNARGGCANFGEGNEWVGHVRDCTEKG
jgi:hypothetical protein